MVQDGQAMEIGRGAEAVITLEGGVVKKWRIPKSYRLPELDEQIRQERTMREARITSEARRCGVPTPIIKDVLKFDLKMEHVDGQKLKDVITPDLSETVGEMVGKLHQAGIIHGDLTTSNMILRDGRIYLIDFGLAFHELSVEAQGVDVHGLDHRPPAPNPCTFGVQAGTALAQRGNVGRRSPNIHDPQ